MVVTLSIRSADIAVPSLSLDAPRIVLGRGRGCDVRIPDLSVSLRHASIRQRGADYLLMDEGSTNGTYVNGARLSPGAPILLKPASAIRLGRVWLDVKIEQAVPSTRPAQRARDIALSLIEGAFAADGQPEFPRLLVRTGMSTGGQLVLDERDRVYVIGRGEDSDLPLDDDEAAERHLEIRRREGEVLVRETGSSSGTFIEGCRLAAGQITALEPGQLISIGNTTIELVDPLVVALRRLENDPDEVMSEEERAAKPARVEAYETVRHTPTGRRRKARATAHDEDFSDDEGDGDAACASATDVEQPSHRDSLAARRDAKNASRAQGSNAPRRWNAADLLTAAVAVAMLAASLAAMVWLLNPS